MNYEVKPLRSELAETFVKYLSNLDFAYAPHWATCFCRYYYLDCSMEEWQKRSGDINRDEALQEIESGRMKGYLAFDGDECIGWCNAANVNDLFRLKNDLDPYCKNKEVGCTVCFVIHPKYRGKGVARLLLKKAIAGFKEKGYEAMIAIPFENKQAPQKRYRGTKNMYEEFGFKEVDRGDTASVMWLDLIDA